MYNNLSKSTLLIIYLLDAEYIVNYIFTSCRITSVIIYLLDAEKSQWEYIVIISLKDTKQRNNTT